MGLRPQGPLGPQGPYGPQGISWKSMHFFSQLFFMWKKPWVWAPGAPGSQRAPCVFYFYLENQCIFFLGFFLCGNRHRARAQGAPGAPWASSNLTNRAGIRVKRHLQKPTISKIAYIIPQKMVFFQFSKMKLHYNAANLPLLKKLRPFHQIYTILMNIFWAAVYCIFTTSII